MSGRVVALSGGIGGAKLALGLSRVLPADELLVVANTGDDFEHLGLSISPDLDTLTYALAGLDNQELGWGRRDESWNFMAALEAMGGETWFRLGDRDLALHIERTRRLREGETLSAVTADLTQRFGIGVKLRPMSNDPIRTRVLTDDGWLDFQHWFVRLRCEPVVREIAFVGAEAARPQPAVIAALAEEPRAIVICPSNPFISIEPILAVPGMREAIRRSGAPVIAVSPIIAGQAVKGPTAKLFSEMGEMPSATAVGRRYGTLLDGFVVEPGDNADDIPCRVFRAPTLMRTLEDKVALARVVLAAADAIAA